MLRPSVIGYAKARKPAWLGANVSTDVHRIHAAWKASEVTPVAWAAEAICVPIRGAGGWHRRPAAACEGRAAGGRLTAGPREAPRAARCAGRLGNPVKKFITRARPGSQARRSRSFVPGQPDVRARHHYPDCGGR
jgi:hypothetical protein